MSKLAKRQEYLIIDYNEMPEKIQDIVRNYHSFHNDCFLKFHSELEPFGNEDWADTCTMSHIEEYWKRQLETNSKYCQSETLEQFIEEYGLQKEKWLMESGIDLKGVKNILIEICW